MTLREMYVDHEMSLSEIGKIMGWSRVGVRDALLRQGVKMRPRGGNRRQMDHKEYAKVAFMYEYMGMTTNEIGETLGLSHDAVANRLHRHGVQMRSRGESVRLRWHRRPKARTATASA